MMSLCTRTRAVSTLCHSLYADWNISARLHFFRWSTYCSHASDSSNLDKKAMLLMGFRFLKFSGSRPTIRVTGELSAQMASNAENASTWWRPHTTPMVNIPWSVITCMPSRHHSRNWHYRICSNVSRDNCYNASSKNTGKACDDCTKSIVNRCWLLISKALNR